MAEPEERLELVKPDVKYAQAYLAMIDAHFSSGEEY